MNKKLIFFLAISAVLISSCKKAETNDEKPSEDSVQVAAPDPAHTSQNSLDWEGEYKGIVPCEDCDGVETSVKLNYDSTFTQSLNYIGKGGPYESTGTFSWDASGGVITLNFSDESKARYRVGEGTLSLLNDDGTPIEGDDYVLRK